MKPITRLLLMSGFLVPVIFWAATIIAAILHGNYSHVRDTISQLGAIGTPSENFMNISTWLCVLLSVAFLAGLYTVCRQAKLPLFPLVGVLGFSLMFGWAAFFHSGHPMHSKSGPMLLLLLIGPLSAALLWKKRPLKTLRILSMLSFVLMLLIVLRVVLPEATRQQYTGLLQRFVHIGWTLWFFALSFTFPALIDRNSTTTLPANQPLI